LTGGLGDRDRGYRQHSYGGRPSGSPLTYGDL